MTKEERRTIVLTSLILLLASVLRFVWEARPVPPILPPREVPEELLAETRAAVEREERMRVPLAEGETLDPNRAPEVELARLPGIGPALASRIVESRDTEGAFRSPSDLLRVSGIGPVTLERIEPVIEFSGSPSGTAIDGPRLQGSGRAVENPALDVNRATAEQLESLPGLGPALSARIVQYRRANGLFERVEQLTEVSGIGEATLQELRGHIRVQR